MLSRWIVVICFTLQGLVFAQKLQDPSLRKVSNSPTVTHHPKRDDSAVPAPAKANSANSTKELQKTEQGEIKSVRSASQKKASKSNNPTLAEKNPPDKNKPINFKYHPLDASNKPGVAQQAKPTATGANRAPANAPH